MSLLKSLISLGAICAISPLASAQVSPYVTAQIEAATKPCADVASASAGQSEARAKSIAIAALQPCYEALQKLDAFEKQNGPGLTAEELNYFYYNGGNVIWMTAAAETMKNDGQVTPAICQQVIAAERSWGNVRVPTGTAVHNDMLTNPLRRMLLPICAPS